MNILLLTLAVLIAIPQNGLAQDAPRNAIIFIADGCGPASFTMARDYGRAIFGRPSLSLDEIQTGAVHTYSVNSLVTDSAAGGTAYACGVKTHNGVISLDSLYRPVGTLVEAAERKGMRTGLVSTARITHATPAVYSSHIVNRDWEAQIADQQIRKGIDLLLGGGSDFYLPDSLGGKRKDGLNAIDEAKDLGYMFVDDRHRLLDDVSLPLLGIFSRDHMAFEIDRSKTDQPSLAEMTATALELLDGGEAGFLVMIEAGRIDHAAHDNDPAAHIHDILAYDEAMTVALDFARRDGRTLIVATSDHETGGLALGRNRNGTAVYAWYPEKLQDITMSIEYFLESMKKRLRNGAQGPHISTYALEQYRDAFHIENPSSRLLVATDDLIGLARKTGRVGIFDRLKPVLGEELSRPAVVAWSTRGHTAVDVNMYSFGPGSDHFRGSIDNTEFGRRMADVLDLDLERETRELREKEQN